LNQTTSEDDKSGKDIVPPKGKKMLPPTIGRDKKTRKFISTQFCSEGDERGKMGAKEVTQKRRKGPN